LDDDLAEPPRGVHTDAHAPLSDQELEESAFQLALAREYPGFGGVYYEPGEERLVLAVTEEGHVGLPAAREAVLEAIGEVAPLTGDAPEILSRTVEHSFLEMAEHRARLRPHLFEVPEVVSLGVDEEFNRIKVGVTDTSVTTSLLQVAAELGVPEAMIAVVLDSPAVPRMATTADSLNSRIPDRMLAGGYEVRALWNPAACSLGFTAFPSRRPATKDFVTASYCSAKEYRPETTRHGWQQPNDSSLESRTAPIGWVGEEMADPEPRRCGFLWLKKCRHADALLVQVDTDSADIAFGKIARTNSRVESCPMGSCDTSINQDNPLIRIAATSITLDNQVVDKIGRTTGWTYGSVRETCTDIELPDFDVWITCSDKLDLLSRVGDSGSPVFRYRWKDNDSVAYLAGIMWGGPSTNNDETWMSSLDQIERDLGELVVADWGGPWVNSIEGPRYPPSRVACTWRAHAGGGAGPLRYEWSGALSGTGNPIRGIAGSGWLKVKVTDLRGQSARDSIRIYAGYYDRCDW